jgi:tRNA A37 methylthiotransferase MiaB
MSVDVLTFGCRLNAYESEVISRNAEGAGLGDAVVVNTCAVTAEAVRQARQAIRRLKRERPQARILVTGCAAQTEPDTFAAMGEVDRVIGNDEKMRAEAWADTRDYLARTPFGIGAEEKIAVNDIMAVTETAAHLIDGLDGRARAFVQVQNGCDHRCTFCIIPMAAVRRARCPPERWSRKFAASLRTAIAKWCSPASISPLGAPTCRASRGLARSCARSFAICRSCLACASPPSIRSKSTRICGARSRKRSG